MNSYKITINTYGPNAIKWFSTKADAKRYAKAQVKLGYTPYIQQVSEDYSTYKTVMFPSVAVLMFFLAVDF